MEFNLVSFGIQLRNIRNQLNMTLEDVSELSGVNAETIRRIESGKVIPKLETLEFLSLTYKQDISSLFLKYRCNSHDYYVSLRTRIENKLYFIDLSNIEEDLQELENFIECTANSFLKRDMRQLYILTQAMVLYKRENDFNSAMDHLTKAIRITIPDFTISRFAKYTYSHIESWILIMFAIIEIELFNNVLAMKILDFCTKIIDINDKLYILLYYNLAYIYENAKEYDKCVAMADKGITACQQNMNFFGLPVLYLYKGIAMYRLGDEGYHDYFAKAITLCQCFGQERFIRLVSKKYEELFKV